MKKLFLNSLTTLAISIAATSAAADPQNWAGPYVGLYYGTAVNQGVQVAGLQAGYNFSNDTLVYGFEVDYLTTFDGAEGLLSVAGRAGMPVSDNAMVFALLGYGTTIGSDMQYVQAGIGAEYQFSANFAARIGVDYLAPASGTPATIAKIGVAYGF